MFKWHRSRRSLDYKRISDRTRPFSLISSSYNRHLSMEALEDRRMLAVFSVTNLNDASTGSLRDAIEQANSTLGPDEITFVGDAFSGTIALSTGQLEVTETLTISGPGQDLLAIDAQQNSRVLNFSNRSGDLTLGGLTLQNGFVENDKGGGLRFDSSGTLSLTGTTISGNNTTGFAANGGGIWTSFGAVTLTSSTVSGNSTTGAAANGGGIFALGGTVTLTDSIVSGNSSTGDVAGGGGIYAGTAVTLTNSTVSENSSSNSGGGIVTINGPVTLTDSTISGNSASGTIGGGGGIFSFYGEVTLNSSTVSGNSSDVDGGGIQTRFGPVTLSDSTVSGNMAAEEGGGVFARYLSSITIQNSIVAGNTAIAAPDLRSYLGSTTLNVNFSLIGDTTSGLTAAQLASIAAGDDNLLDVAPLLGPLADNGGLTRTHALLPGSPALDTGDDDVTEIDDQRGLARNVNGVDIGAYEAQVAPSADFDTDGDVDGSDFLAWQRGFGKLYAQRADGNSDDDTDTDVSDFAAWKVSYGNIIPPLAAVEDGQSAVGNVALIDAAIALEWQSSEAGEESSFLADQPAIVAVFAANVASDKQLPQQSDNSEVDVENPPADEALSQDQPWHTEELLERVFG